VPALADNNLNCNAYAQSAIDQQNQNLKQKCGFKGGRWSLDFAGHLNWCKKSNIKMHNLTNEQKARIKALGQCTSTKQQAKDQQKEQKLEAARCGLYALAAPKIVADHGKACNKNNGKPSKFQLKQYCKKIGSKAAMAENKQLLRDAKSCKFKSSYCKKYAASMVKYAKKNIKHKCGYQSSHYDNNSKGHNQWCLSAPTKLSKKALKDARKGIKACTTDRIKVFDKPGGKWTPTTGYTRWLLIDVCATKKGKYCGKANADLYCRSKGYAKSIRHKTKSVNFGSGKASTWWHASKQACHGKCGGFTKIVCKGKR